MFVNELYQGGIRALLDYDNTIFNDMVLPSGIARQDVIDHIIFKYGDAPLFCPDPAVMKYYFKSWSTRRLDLWDRMKKLIESQYDPLENYDRREKYKREYTHGHTVEGLISADNSSAYQPDNKAVNAGKDIAEEDNRIHGNIGTVTAQQMFHEEYDVIPMTDLIDYIADDWHQEFNLMMYN